MNPKYTFLSILTSNDYLPGLLVLEHSLQKTGAAYPFLTLLTPNISPETRAILDSHEIAYKILDYNLDNPTNVNRGHRWSYTYSKIFIFGQTEYDKVVYLDVDMLVLRNIDELFTHKHLSATNAGGSLPRKKHWTHMNSGIMVIEPSRELFEDMVSKIGKIETLKSGGAALKPQHGSDQDFINAYFRDWPNQKELHLDHKYNIFHYYLEEYNKFFGYTIEDSDKPISIIHYANYSKPWNPHKNETVINPMEARAVALWQQSYKEIE